MDKELKAKWVAALRSGEIKQGRGALLNDAGELCCIGVLGRLVGISDADLYDGREYLGQCAGAPELGPLEDVGLPASKISALADMNDGRTGHQPKSFAEIADYIEVSL